MKNKSAVIIIDTGFSPRSTQAARKILAVIDVASQRVVTGSGNSPYLTWERDAGALEAVSRDDLNHGSIVLDRLTASNPELPVVLVRAYDDSVKLVRTEFAGGKQVRPGWTEAYRAAVDICLQRGLASVANLSFGGYTHAMDGTGWESHVLAHDTGAGKPGHIILAGAGSGNGTAIHASWRTTPGGTEEVNAFQSCPTTYNLWCAADASAPESGDWLLEVFLNDHKVWQELATNVGANLWNNRKQVNFHVPGAGKVRIRTSRFYRSDDGFGGGASGFADSGKRPLLVTNTPSGSRADQLDPHGFDCWIVQKECDAMFLDHKDGMSIAEPAIFPHVIAVGLKSGEYAPDQNEPGAKPDLLIDGAGPISFRLPEVVAQVAELLGNDPTLDVVAVRKWLCERKAA